MLPCVGHIDPKLEPMWILTAKFWGWMSFLMPNPSLMWAWDWQCTNINRVWCKTPFYHNNHCGIYIYNDIGCSLQVSNMIHPHL